MQRSRLILQNAASKAAAAKVAGESSLASVKHLQFHNKISFDEKTAAQILSSRRNHHPSFYKPLYHHLDPSLLTPREPGSFSYLLHHLQSSLSGFYSICTSQQSRDEFLHLTARNDDKSNNNGDGEENNNTGIINTFVLNQSDMGFMKVMTLYQDLSSPLFDEANFDTEMEVRQFLDGCSFALEQFHTIQADYLKNLEATLDTVTVDNSGSNDAEHNSESNTKEEEEVAETDKQFQYKFFDVAENDPESTESALASMLSPEGLDRIFFDTAMYSFVKNMSGQMVEGADSTTENHNSLAELPSDPKVMHACLLSARVEEIEASVEKQEKRNEEDNDPDAPLEDESLQPFADRKSQTLLQLEVLYDLEFLTTTVATKANTADDSNNSKSFKSVNVAKFETCIKNNPNGDERQWRLCSWRPAREFGHL